VRGWSAILIGSTAVPARDVFRETGIIDQPFRFDCIRFEFAVETSFVPPYNGETAPSFSTPAHGSFVGLLCSRSLSVYLVRGAPCYSRARRGHVSDKSHIPRPSTSYSRIEREEAGDSRGTASAESATSFLQRGKRRRNVSRKE